MKKFLNIVKNKIKEFRQTNDSIPSQILASSNDKQSPNITKFVADYKWPLFRQPLLESFMLKYLHSYKTVNNQLNQSNLLILCGPEGIGKSWFLKMNLRIFSEKTNVPSIIMHWDMSNTFLINFDTFLTKFKQLFLTTLQDAQTTYPDLSLRLNEDIILKILLARYDSNLIQIYIERHILWLLDGEDPINLDQQGIDYIIQIKQVFDNKKFKENVVNNIWADYITSHQHMYNQNRLITTLVLCLNIIDKMEHFQRPEAIVNQYYLTGIESTDFMFDVLNYIAGYHDLDNYQDRSPDQIDNYYHPVIVLEGFDKLLQSQRLDPRINDLLDHFILRFFTDTKCRSSFPLIIETNDTLFFNKNIYALMNIKEDELAFIELYGWLNQENQLVKHIYTDLQRYQIEKILGMHIGDWYKFTKEVVYDGTLSFDDALEFSSGVLLKEKKIFYNKLSKLYTLHHVKESLDQDLIDFEILYVFEGLIHKKIGNGFFVGSEYGQLILEKPILKALISVDILYLRHFFSYLQISKRLYVHFIKEYVLTKKRQMTLTQKLQYYKYKKQHGFDVIDLSILATANSSENYDPKKSFSYEINPYHGEMNLEVLKVYKPNPLFT